MRACALCRGLISAQGTFPALRYGGFAATAERLKSGVGKGNKYAVTVPGQNQPQKINRPREKGAYADEMISPVRSRRNVWQINNLAGIMAAELGLNPKTARRAGLLHDIGKVPDDEPELPHAIIGMKLAEKYKEKPEVCNAIGAHHDEVEMTSLIAPIIQVCDAISGARPGARREVVESYIKRLKEMEDIALSYPGVVKTYAIQAGRELRVIVGADKLTDQESEGLSHDIAKKIQDEMTYPGQVKITVIRETRAVSYAK